MGELFLSLVGLAGILVGSAWVLNHVHKKEQQGCCCGCEGCNCNECHCGDSEGCGCGCKCCKHKEDEE